ncbi:MAG: hypothetical protein R8P61_26545 [Bacteroidia bacterium]|nr:hypothetical protein [Bacteroidia bacterium]
MMFDSRKFYPQSLVFYLACLSGMLIFALVTYFLNLQNGALGDPPFGIWIWISAAFGLMGILSSDFSFSWLSRRLDPHSSWEFRSRNLRIALIIRYLLLQLSATVAGVAFIISGNMYTFLIMLGIIGFSLFRWPRREQLIQQLHASQDESELI